MNREPWYRRVAMNQDTRIDWKPIATAPKDGTQVLLCNVAASEFAVAHWGDVSMSGSKGWQVGCVVTDWNDYIEFDDPTHWALLTLPCVDNEERKDA